MKKGNKTFNPIIHSLFVCLFVLISLFPAVPLLAPSSFSGPLLLTGILSSFYGNPRFEPWGLKRYLIIQLLQFTYFKIQPLNGTVYQDSNVFLL